MKIAIISNLYPPIERGGAEQVAKMMAENLVLAGHEVKVLSSHGEKKITRKFENGVEIIRINPKNIFYYLNDYRQHIFFRFLWQFLDVFNFWTYFKTKKFLQDFKPNWVICHNLKGLGYLIPLAIKKAKIKSVYFAHDVQLAIPSGLIFWNRENSFIVKGFPTKIYQKIVRRLFKSFTIFLSPSNWLKDFYEQKKIFQNSKKYLLKNPDLTVEPKEKSVFQKQNRFLYIGQIEEHKGVEWLLELWKKHFLKYEIILIGDGSKRELWQQKYPFAQFVGRVEATIIFDRVDFLLVPTLCYENAPSIIPKALKAGLPVIVNNFAGAGELITDGYNGFHAKPKDAIFWRELIEKVVKISEESYFLLSKNAQKSVQGLTISNFIKDLENNLKEN